jgi:crotonobetainyl-CoA:carnitine CoA-transferase CaiB-like acyl-CoA transferase
MCAQSAGDGLLSGFRVLDLTDEKGLLCGKVLGDLGADVIKIERPGGDPARNVAPFYKDIPDPEKSLFWFYTNINKRGITLDMEAAAGRDLFGRLVKTAHFVVESFTPGYMAGLGLSYPDLEKINPAVIMTSITPYGQTGPYAMHKTTDIVICGMGGQMRCFGDSDRAPVRISQPQAFFLGGIQGVLGSMMAHYYRQSTGEGQHVDVSCQEAVALTLLSFPQYWDILKINYKREGPSMKMARPEPYGPLVRQHVYACKDGHVVGYIAGGAQSGLVASSRALTEWANSLGYAEDLRDYDWTKMDFGTMPQSDLDRVQDGLQPFLMSRTKAEIMAKAVEKSLVMIPVNNAQDVFESPQLRARGFFQPVDHPELGQALTYPGFPITITGFTDRPQRRAPLVGEHNEEIYLGELGLSRDEMARLKTAQVI